MASIITMIAMGNMVGVAKKVGSIAKRWFDEKNGDQRVKSALIRKFLSEKSMIIDKARASLSSFKELRTSIESKATSIRFDKCSKTNPMSAVLNAAIKNFRSDYNYQVQCLTWKEDILFKVQRCNLGILDAQNSKLEALTKLVNALTQNRTVTQSNKDTLNKTKPISAGRCRPATRTSKKQSWAKVMEYELNDNVLVLFTNRGAFEGKIVRKKAGKTSRSTRYHVKREDTGITIEAKAGQLWKQGQFKLARVKNALGMFPRNGAFTQIVAMDINDKKNAVDRFSSLDERTCKKCKGVRIKFAHHEGWVPMSDVYHDDVRGKYGYIVVAREAGKRRLLDGLPIPSDKLSADAMRRRRMLERLYRDAPVDLDGSS